MSRARSKSSYCAAIRPVIYTGWEIIPAHKSVSASERNNILEGGWRDDSLQRAANIRVLPKVEVMARIILREMIINRVCLPIKWNPVEISFCLTPSMFSVLDFSGAKTSLWMIFQFARNYRLEDYLNGRKFSWILSRNVVNFIREKQVMLILSNL